MMGDETWQCVGARFQWWWLSTSEPFINAIYKLNKQCLPNGTLTIREERLPPIQILNRTIYEAPSSLSHPHRPIPLFFISRNPTAHVSSLTHHHFSNVPFPSHLLSHPNFESLTINLFQFWIILTLNYWCTPFCIFLGS